MSQPKESHAEQANAWLVTMRDDPSAADRAGFEAWLGADPEHQAAWRAAQAGWAASGAVGARLAEAESEALQGYLRAMDRTAASRRRRRQGGIALLLLSCLAAGLWLERPHLWQDLGADHVSARAERRQVTLPDGSTVLLDADSALAVDYAPTARRVRLLRGGGFFDVTHGATPFVVETEAGSVHVLGTRFDLRLTGDGGTVTLERGRVEVDAAGTVAQLTPGQQVGFDASGVQAVQPADLSDAAAWREGRLVFYRRPLAEVVAEIERYRPGRIVFARPGLARTLVTGSFALDDTDAALASLQASVGFRLNVLAGRLTVIGP